MKCIKGELVSPCSIQLENGETIDIRKETFYELGRKRYFLLDDSITPNRVIKGILATN